MAEEGKTGHPGVALLHWTVDEYERHARGPLWYLFAAMIGGGLVIYALATQNFLFAVIVIMFGVIIGLSSMREPRRLPFVITDLGVSVGSKFYPYKELGYFWMLYEPPDVKNLYIEFKRSPRPHLVVPLNEQDPLAVRETLLRFIDEELEQQDEPLSDVLGRLLKL